MQPSTQKPQLTLRGLFRARVCVRVFTVMPHPLARDLSNQRRKCGTTLFESDKIFNSLEAFHLRFDRNVTWNHKVKFFEVSVGPHQPVKKDKLRR